MSSRIAVERAEMVINWDRDLHPRRKSSKRSAVRTVGAISGTMYLHITSVEYYMSLRVGVKSLQSFKD
jgi:hypothetical protein